MEEPAYFEFVVRQGKNRESRSLRVLADELHAHWGPEVTQVFRRYAGRSMGSH